MPLVTRLILAAGLILLPACVEGDLNVNLGLGSGAEEIGDKNGIDQQGNEEENDDEVQPCYKPLSKAAKAELDSMGYSKTKHPSLYQFLVASGRLRNSLPPCPAE